MADPSWEDLLADPMWQTPFDSELLPHLLAFGPPVDIEVRRCRCAAVHIGRCSSEVVTPSRTDRQPPTSATQAKGGYSPVDPGTTKHPDLVTHHEET